MTPEQLASLRERVESGEPAAIAELLESVGVLSAVLMETLKDIDCAFGHLSSDHNRAKSFMYKAMTRLRKLLKA